MYYAAESNMSNRRISNSNYNSTKNVHCEYCGSELSAESDFCASCGAPAEHAEFDQTVRRAETRNRKTAEKRVVTQKKRISENITLCSDGKYRWVYKMSLFRNPTVFLLVWKIFFFVFIGIFAFVFLADALNGYMDSERMLENLRFLGYFMLGMTVVVSLGYLLYAAIMGGKYIVEFEMDENGVNHKQIASQAKKAKKIGRAAAVAGLAAGRFSAVGAGINAQRTEMYSDFSKTKKVRAYPRRHLIKVNGVLSHNQVYAAPEDFEFVKHYILSKCINLKK